MCVTKTLKVVANSVLVIDLCLWCISTYEKETCYIVLSKTCEVHLAWFQTHTSKVNKLQQHIRYTHRFIDHKRKKERYSLKSSVLSLISVAKGLTLRARDNILSYDWLDRNVCGSGLISVAFVQVAADFSTVYIHLCCWRCTYHRLSFCCKGTSDVECKWKSEYIKVHGFQFLVRLQDSSTTHS